MVPSFEKKKIIGTQYSNILMIGQIEKTLEIELMTIRMIAEV